MYRTVHDFLMDWEKSSHGTLQVLESLTDNTLSQAIVEGHSTLGWLGWHITTSTSYFANLVGLDIQSPGNPNDVPSEAKSIADAFKKIAEEVKQKAEQMLTDENMLEEVDGFGQPIPRGALLRTLLDHTIHHRGQMTVLLRQAGLRVPSVLGPTKEDQMK